MAADPFLTSFVRVQSDLRDFRAQTEAGVRESVKKVEQSGAAAVKVQAGGLDPSRGLAGLRESLSDLPLKVALVNDLIRNGISEQKAFKAVTSDVLKATTEQASQQAIVNNLIAQGVSEQEALAAASGRAARQTEASAGAFGGQGRALAGGILRVGLYGAALQTAFQLQRELSDELKVTGSEATTTTGRLRNMAAAAVQFDIVGVFKAARQELELTNEEIELQLELGRQTQLQLAAQAFGNEKLAAAIRQVAAARQAAQESVATSRAELTKSPADDLALAQSRLQATRAQLRNLKTPEEIQQDIERLQTRIAGILGLRGGGGLLGNLRRNVAEVKRQLTTGALGIGVEGPQPELLRNLSEQLQLLKDQLDHGVTLTTRKRAELKAAEVALTKQIQGIKDDQKAEAERRAEIQRTKIRESISLQESRIENQRLVSELAGDANAQEAAARALIALYRRASENVKLTNAERERYRTALLSAQLSIQQTREQERLTHVQELNAIAQAALENAAAIAATTESTADDDAVTALKIAYYRRRSNNQKISEAARKEADRAADLLEAQQAQTVRQRQEAAAEEAKQGRLTRAALREQSLIAAQTAAAATAGLRDDRESTAALVAFYRQQSRNADLTAQARADAREKAKAAAAQGAIQIQDTKLARLRERQAVRATQLENLAAAASLTTTNTDDQRVLTQQAAFIKNSFKAIEALLLSMIRQTAVGSARRKQLQQILFAERQKANAALTQVQQQQIAVAGPDPLKLQKLETRALRAQLTDTRADDKAVLEDEIRLWQQAIKNTKLKGAARRAFVEAATQEILRLRIAIKNLSDQTKGAFGDISALATLSNELLQKFLPNIQFDANGGITNLFGRGTGTPGGATATTGGAVTGAPAVPAGQVSGAGRFVDALNQNTQALRDVKSGLGTTVDVDFNFTGDPNEGVDAKAAAARMAFLSAFDG